MNPGRTAIRDAIGDLSPAEAFAAAPPKPYVSMTEQLVPETYALDVANAALASLPPCVWRQDEDGCWATGCGQLWSFDGAGEPADHGCRFCFHCGHPLQAVAYEPDPVEEDADPCPGFQATDADGVVYADHDEDVCAHCGRPPRAHEEDDPEGPLFLEPRP